MQVPIITLSPICRLSKKHQMLKTSIFNKIIAEFIIKNDGSHTRLTGYLNKDTTQIKILQNYETKVQITARKIRYVWLETSAYTKITFARSLWATQIKNISLKRLEGNTPIGTFFIKEKIDINKEIIELQYCYCQYLEKYLGFKEAIICKKYKLNYNNKSNIIIQEFFSPNLFKI